MLVSGCWWVRALVGAGGKAGGCWRVLGCGLALQQQAEPARRPHLQPHLTPSLTLALAFAPLTLARPTGLPVLPPRGGERQRHHGYLRRRRAGRHPGTQQPPWLASGRQQSSARCGLGLAMLAPAAAACCWAAAATARPPAAAARPPLPPPTGAHPAALPAPAPPAPGVALQVFPEAGTVCFSAGLHGWAFTLTVFSKLYAKKVGAGGWVAAVGAGCWTRSVLEAGLRARSRGRGLWRCLCCRPDSPTLHTPTLTTSHPPAIAPALIANSSAWRRSA